MRIGRIVFAVASCAMLMPAAAASQQYSEAVHAPYRVVPNIIYLTASGFTSKLDVYSRVDTENRPLPTLVWFHGGGWIGGNKESDIFALLPYLEMGWNVVNVEYRLSNIASAPAAVEDAFCALRWVSRNAGEYGFDIDNIIASGRSAGGHLALALGTLSDSAGLGRLCPGADVLNVAGGIIESCGS